MLNRSAAVPAEITLRGPTSELDQIASVVATVSSDAELSDTTTVPRYAGTADENGEVYTPSTPRWTARPPT